MGTYEELVEELRVAAIEAARREAWRLPPGYANEEEYEHAMDMAFVSSDADLRMAARGVRLADFEGPDGFFPDERSKMSTSTFSDVQEEASAETLEDALAPGQTPCRVIIAAENGEAVYCGKPAPGRGRYTGVCKDHRRQASAEAGHQAAAAKAAAKPTRKRRAKPKVDVGPTQVEVANRLHEANALLKQFVLAENEAELVGLRLQAAQMLLSRPLR